MSFTTLNIVFGNVRLTIRAFLGELKICAPCCSSRIMGNKLHVIRFPDADTFRDNYTPGCVRP